MVRHLASALLIAVGSQVLGPVATAPAVAYPLAISAGRYGVNQDLEWDPPDQVPAEIRLMKAAGVQWLRLPLRWQWLEPAPGLYRWDRVDPVIDQAADAGLKLLLVLGGTPAWSSGEVTGPVMTGVHLDAFAPRGDHDFAVYVDRVVRHYRGRVQVYELFNEPNSPNHWLPAPNSARYAELLCAGYHAAKRADPNSVIVAGGLNGNGLSHGPAGSLNFLPALYATEGAACFDVLAIHPFAHPLEQGLRGLQAWVDETRRYMAARHDPRELWLTEIGWSTGPRQWGHATISEVQQARWVTSVYRELQGAQKVFWYNFKEVRPNPSDADFEWGWLRYDLAPKPGYWAFADLAT